MINSAAARLDDMAETETVETVQGGPPVINSAAAPLASRPSGQFDLSNLDAGALLSQLVAGATSVTFQNFQPGAFQPGAAQQVVNNASSERTPPWAKRFEQRQQQQGQQLGDIHKAWTTTKKAPASASRYNPYDHKPENLASAFESNSASPE